MGIFDFFSKNQKTETTSRRLSFDDLTTNDQTTVPSQKGPMTVFHPKSFKDVESIIVSLKEGKQAMVYLGELSESTSYRVLDMLCGAIFALDGGVFEVEKNIFMFNPNGVEVN